MPTGGLPTWWGPTARFPFWERESEARTHKRCVVSKDFKVMDSPGDEPGDRDGSKAANVMTTGERT